MKARSLRTRVAVLVAGLSVLLAAALGGWLWLEVREASLEALDRELATRAEVLAGLVELEKDGTVELEGDGLEIPFRVETPAGRVLEERGIDWPALPAGRHERVEFVRLGERTYRILTRPVRLEHGGRVVLRVATSAGPVLELRRRIGTAVLVSILAAAIVGALAAALVARTTTAPLRALARRVGTLDEASLHERIEPRGGDREVIGLTAAFNELLGRLEAAFERQRAFVARASHALRTPTATILTRAEVTLARPRGEEEYRRALDEIAGAARESAALVDHLLALARLEEREKELRREPVPLARLAAELERLLAPRARAAGVSLAFEVEADAALDADRSALRELLEALLDNALRYTPRGGAAGLRASRRALVVWDTGPGMTADDKAQAFERFFRGSAAERSGAPGSGLGLAIARAVAERHGASLQLGDREGGGLEVTVRWPV